MKFCYTKSHNFFERLILPWSLNHYTYLIVVVVKFLSILNLNAQYNTFSPFSRYGIGDIQDNTLTYQKSMNNIGIALPIDTTAPCFINLLNPAAMAYLKLTVIEANGSYYSTQIKNPQNYKVKQNSTNFNALVIGFPIKKHSGFSFGILPYSFVGYNISQNKDLINAGTINYVYDGSGGINKVFGNFGFSLSKYFKQPDTSRNLLKHIIKNTSLGISVYYMFGELAQTATVNYPGTINYYNFVNDKRYRINGVSADIGIQTFFHLNKNKDKTLNIGFVYSNPSKLGVVYDYIAYNFLYNYYGQKYIVDTIIYQENQINKMKLPAVFGLGMSYIKGNKYGVNIDVKYFDWSKFYLPNSPADVKNNFSMNIGGYYQPDRFMTGKGNYFNKVIYRGGIGYNNGYQDYNGQSIPMYSISAGASFPMGLYRSFSAMHIALQYNIKGSRSFVLRENILRISIGVTLNDRWFIKYKYD